MYNVLWIKSLCFLLCNYSEYNTSQSYKYLKDLKIHIMTCDTCWTKHDFRQFLHIFDIDSFRYFKEGFNSTPQNIK